MAKLGGGERRQITKPHEIFDVMEVEAASLEAFLDDLPRERWVEPSACEGWLVGDVVAHLASGSSSYISRIRKSLGEEVSFTPSDQAPLPAGIAERARRLREEAGEALVDDFKRGNQELSSFLRGLAPDQLQAKSRLAGGEVEAWFYGALRTTELSIHGWDIRRPFDPGSHISEAALGSFIDAHFPTFVPRAIRPGEDEIRTGRFRFELTKPARSVEITLEAGAPSMGPATAANPDATLRATAEDFAMLVYGRAGYDALAAEGRLSIEGDRKRTDAFGRLCRGI